MGLRLERTRVVLAMPRMLGDIVQGVLDAQADIEVVATLDRTESLLDAVTRCSADLVIVAEDQFSVPLAWLDLLEACPRLRLLAVASERHRRALCEVLGDVPPGSLVQTVRSARPRA
jgi:hypothetical protein